MIKFTVNGQAHQVPKDDKRMLLAYLREDLQLMGTKNGCNKGHCGTCMVIIDKQAQRACITKISQCAGKSIETVESLGSSDDLHPLQQAFIDEGAVQCGFCTPGMLLAAKALLDDNLNPTEADIRHALRYNICRCTGYGAIIRAIEYAAHTIREQTEQTNMRTVSKSDKQLKSALVPGRDDYVEDQWEVIDYIGDSVPRKDALAKVLGKGIFADDLIAAGCLYGQMLFSEHAHAEIVAIDTTAAEQMPGVHKIVTHQDIPGLNKFGLFVAQQPVLCDKKVKYLGDVIACVYADTKLEAQMAVKQIKVHYKVLEAQLDAEQNFLDNSAIIHDDQASNIVHHVSVRKGDVEQAFGSADIVIENTYLTQAVEHAYLEPEACLAEAIDGGVTVWTGNQGSEAYKKMIMQTLDLTADKVRVVLTAMGGGFGGKEEPTVQILAALGAVLTQKPIKMVLTREESMRMSTKRHPMKITMKHGINKDGTILAMQSRVIADAGAYVSQTNPVIFRSAVTATGPYIVENVAADSWGVCTHKNPSGAFRGFGSTQASFASESQLDQLAKAIGMSAYELRYKNGFRSGIVTSTGQVLKDGVGYIGTLDAAYQALQKMEQTYNSDEATKNRPAHIKVGYGLASAYKNVGIGTGKPDKAGAFIELMPNGRVLVSVGATDMGQGSDTVMAQIAATTLSVPYKIVDVIACDTASCPDGGMTTASRQTYVTGNAVKQAAELLKIKMLKLISEHQLTITNKQWSQGDLIKTYIAATDGGQKLRIEHEYYPPKTYAHRTDANHKPGEDLSTYDIHYAYCFASAAVALEVNIDTGAVKVLKVHAAQDVGTAIHPKNLIGQIEGAVAMGVGMALTEEFTVDDKQVLTDNLHKLKLLNAEQMPLVECTIVEELQLAGPYGAKGMGEVGLNPLPPAIANAIADAVGVRCTTLPIKAEQIKKLLSAKRD